MLRIDEPMDIFAGHGIAGIVGLVFNALFGADYIIGLDGVNTGSTLQPGGWLNHHYRLLYVQVAYIVACAAYSFVVSFILAFAINMMPGLGLRVSSQCEVIGLDNALEEDITDFAEVKFKDLQPPAATVQKGEGVEPSIDPSQNDGNPLDGEEEKIEDAPLPGATGSENGL